MKKVYFLIALSSLLSFTQASAQAFHSNDRNLPASTLPATSSESKPSWWDSHPRVMLTESKLEHIKKNYARSAVFNSLYQFQIKEAQTLLTQKLPVFRETSDPEQLWQRSVGDALPILAMAYKLTRDVKYLQAAISWSREIMKYPVWGVEVSDLAAGHLLFGIATVYDWCYDDLDAAFRLQLEQEILKRGKLVYQSLLPGGSWIRDVYLQNHLWVTEAGLLAATVAIIDKYPELQPWIDIVKTKQKKTFELLGSDGASHEGVAYWTYGVEYLLRYMDIVRDLYGEDHFKSEWFRKTAHYYLALSLPGAGWLSNLEIVDIADSPRKSWYGPNHILRKLAAEYRDGYAQQRAAELDSRFKRYAGSEWQGLLWYDDQLAGESIHKYPTTSFFEDMGIVSSRTGWEDNASLLVVKSAPPLGHSILKYHNSFGSAGHVHPDAGSFSLFSNGRFLIRNPGYSMKRTAYQNTLLVNGKGQKGEQRWFRYTPTAASAEREKHTTIKVIRKSKDLDYIIANAATAYDTGVGLKTFRRHIVFIKSISTVILLDEIELANPGNISLHFHPEIPAVQMKEKRSLVSRDTLATLWIQALSSDANVSSLAADTLIATGGKPYFLPLVKVEYSNKSSVWSPVALSWGNGSEKNIAPEIHQQHLPGSGNWEFKIREKGKLILDPVNHTVRWNNTKAKKK